MYSYAHTVYTCGCMIHLCVKQIVYDADAVGRRSRTVSGKSVVTVVFVGTIFAGFGREFERETVRGTSPLKQGLSPWPLGTSDKPQGWCWEPG